jgi:hypothetical protein
LSKRKGNRQAAKATKKPKSYKPVPVEVARQISADYDKNVVVIIAMDHAHCCTHSTTFGFMPNDKHLAASLGEFFVTQMGCDVDARKTYEDFRTTRQAELAYQLDQYRRFERCVRAELRDPEQGASQTIAMIEGRLDELVEALNKKG